MEQLWLPQMHKQGGGDQETLQCRNQCMICECNWVEGVYFGCAARTLKERQAEYTDDFTLKPLMSHMKKHLRLKMRGWIVTPQTDPEVVPTHLRELVDSQKAKRAGKLDLLAAQPSLKPKRAKREAREVPDYEFPLSVYQEGGCRCPISEGGGKEVPQD